jgi:hypothetical protein
VTARARTLATKLFSPETIQEHLSSSISPNRIVEVGMITSSQELADSGWAKVIEELRKQKRESHEVIKLAERFAHRPFIGEGEVYYEMMLCRRKSWTSLNSGLASDQVQKPFSGSFQCSEAFDEIIQFWTKKMP